VGPVGQRLSAAKWIGAGALLGRAKLGRGEGKSRAGHVGEIKEAGRLGQRGRASGPEACGGKVNPFSFFFCNFPNQVLKCKFKSI